MTRHPTTTLLALAAGGLAGLAVLASSTGVLPAGPSTPARLELRRAPGLVPPSTRLVRVPRPLVPRPGYLSQQSDPVFASTITRISDQEGLDTTSRFLRHSSAKRQPWNSDGSRLLLGFAQPGRLLDGRSYVFRGPVLRESAGGVWSNTDPDAFFVTEGAQLLRLSARAQQAQVLHAVPGATELTIGHGQGSPANDDHGLVLIATGPERTRVLNYDPLTDRVLGSLVLSSADARTLEWAAVSQTGDHVVLSWGPDGDGPGQGVEVLDRTLQRRRALFPYSEASDLCLDEAGEDVHVTFDPTTGKTQGDQQKIVSVRLRDGAVQDVLRTDWVGSDLSCRNTERPGWAYVSDGAADRPRARTGGFDEVYAVALDGSGTVQRFAHARQSPGAEPSARSSAVPSRDGTRVLWASDWLGGPDAPTYAYVATFAGPAVASAGHDPGPELPSTTLPASALPRPSPGPLAVAARQQAGESGRGKPAPDAGDDEAGAVRQVHGGEHERQRGSVEERGAAARAHRGDPEDRPVRAQAEASGQAQGAGSEHGDERRGHQGGR